MVVLPLGITAPEGFCALSIGTVSAMLAIAGLVSADQREPRATALAAKPGAPG